MKYVYTRVSTLSQDLESQIQTLENEGCKKIHSEKFTGTRADRPQFQNSDKKTPFLRVRKRPLWLCFHLRFCESSLTICFPESTYTSLP